MPQCQLQRDGSPADAPATITDSISNTSSSAANASALRFNRTPCVERCAQITGARRRHNRKPCGGNVAEEKALIITARCTVKAIQPALSLSIGIRPGPVGVRDATFGDQTALNVSLPLPIALGNHVTTN